MSETQYVARIKPDSPRKSHHTLGISFERETGWYIVTAEQAKKLRKVRLHEMGNDTTKVFDVKTDEQAAEMEKVAKLKKKLKGTPFKPVNPHAPHVEEVEDEDDEDEEEDDDPPAPRRLRRTSSPPPAKLPDARGEDEEEDEERDDGREELLADLEIAERNAREAVNLADGATRRAAVAEQVVEAKDAELRRMSAEMDRLRKQLAQEGNGNEDTAVTEVPKKDVARPGTTQIGMGEGQNPPPGPGPAAGPARPGAAHGATTAATDKPKKP